jgi:AcrR family transcriptional regulator
LRQDLAHGHKRQGQANRRGVKSRELVLDAAERVMAEHGYDGASVEHVVEETGIPKSSVYLYFGSRHRPFRRRLPGTSRAAYLLVRNRL